MPQKTNFPQRARREDIQNGHMVVQQNLEQLRDAWDNIGVQVPGLKAAGAVPVWDAATQTWIASTLNAGKALPGQELALVTQGANVNVVGTTSATGTLVCGPTSAITFDGATSVYCEFWAYAWQRGTSWIQLGFRLDAVAGLAHAFFGAAADPLTPAPLYARSEKMTPSAGSHVFNVVGWVDAGTGVVYGGPAAGAGTGQLATLRVFKA